MVYAIRHALMHEDIQPAEKAAQRTLNLKEGESV